MTRMERDQFTDEEIANYMPCVGGIEADKMMEDLESENRCYRPELGIEMGEC